ncbi:MAG: cysteine--tRNA ligase [Deltaproteobacteria bacterium]|nr:cysteine--tRNA ligase [Deltaproteobacteria bacterium]
MSLKLYNSSTRNKEVFKPINDGRVGIYVCGVTVYDLCHIGHARSTIVFDVLARYFRARGYDVTYVRNFTDIDDKIIERAKQLKKAPKELAQAFIDAFYEDMEKLGVLKANVEPRATDYVEDMIEMTRTLMDRGYAYTEGGDVYFSVDSYRGYGSLSGRNLEDMRAGSRVAVDDRKRHPMDFVLWKRAKPGEPQWPSPWGPGRPGWHLECSVMSNRHLGPTFDIHGGGRDLLFPHHENERAQSICANDGEFARYWVHNGFVTVESEKMSKSLGNFLTIRDALKKYHPEVLRLFLLSKHYRSPLDFSAKDVAGLQSGLVRIYRTLQRLNDLLGPGGEEKTPSGSVSNASGEFFEKFCEMMDDDLNTAGALGLVFDKVREMNRLMDPDGNGAVSQETLSRLKNQRAQLLQAGNILGLFQQNPAAFFEQLAAPSRDVNTDEIEALVEKRSQARAAKDWALSDAVRDELKDMGVILEDGPQGTTWRLDV